LQVWALYSIYLPETTGAATGAGALKTGMEINFSYIKEKLRGTQCPEKRTSGKWNIIPDMALVSVIIIMVAVNPVLSFGNSISWTEDELAFMKEHPVILIGVDPGFVPYEFVDENGEYKGIAADYIDLISEITGLKFEVVEGLSWPEAYEMALTGKVDMLPIVGKTAEREENFLLSDPYYYYKRVIVTRNEDTDISGIEDLSGKTAAVQRNSSHHSYLLSFSHINLSLYDTVEAALTAVATGTEKAFIGNLATTNYIIHLNGLTNLRFVAFEAEKQHSLHFAVRKDWPELVSILNKALNSISESEKLAISNKWVGLSSELNYRQFIRIALCIGSLVAVILMVSFFWIAQLRREIRQRKKIQLDLEQAKYEADKANDFKSGLIAMMSHEIRTSLNAIIGMSYLLKRTDLSLTQSMYIERTLQAANNMLSIINDILDFSKIEAGKVELEAVSFSLDQMIHKVVSIIYYKIDEQGIGFRLIRDPLLPDYFLGDSGRIEHILLNVLNNAVKFTDRGEVSLDVRLLAKENDIYHVAFTVKDTGIGMTEEQLNKLFKPFEQGDININRRFGGSGLGLSIVKSLVDMMGGEIEVYSTPGEGSTFIVRLPLCIDMEKETESEKIIADKKLKDLRILILGKSGENINLVESYLKSFGMQCEITSSELSAVSMLEAANGKDQNPFDLLIIDYETPDEGGFCFVEKIKKNGSISKMPKILMLLPMMKEELFDKLKEYGTDAGIEKPVIPSVLLNSIMDIFGMKPAPLARSYKEAALTGPHRQYRILLVEDSNTNRLIAETLLKQGGMELIAAGNGKEAVELYKEYKDSVDLILMDLHMPVMDGCEAAVKIRQLSADVPIVALTADVGPGIREKCEQCGIHYYISKPFNPDQFIQTIRDILGRTEAKTDDSGMVILDRQLGLNNMENNIELYEMVLKEYRNENQHTLVRLETAIREKRYADAAKIVHKMKSSTGSIGAKLLYETAVSLQKALEEEKEEKIMTLYTRFSDLLEKLLDILK